MQETLKYKFPEDSTIANSTLGTEDSIVSLILNAAKNSKAKVDMNKIQEGYRVMTVRFTSTESQVQYILTCSHLAEYLAE